MFVSKDQKTQRRLKASRRKRLLRSRPRWEGRSPSLARAIAGVMGVDLEMLGLAGQSQQSEASPRPAQDLEAIHPAGIPDASPADASGSGKTRTESQASRGDA